VYKEYLQLFVSDFPVERIDEITVDDVMGYGTTKDEKIIDVKGLAELIENQRKEGVGADFRFDRFPVYRRLLADEQVAIFVDEIAISMVTDEGKHEFSVRASIICEYINEVWKMVHWHASKPDELEKDTWHRDEWKRKNEELQRLVNEKTADLELKNRELIIEGCLERVRSTAMGMKAQDDLIEVAKALFEELVKLGFTKIRNAQIDVLNDEEQFFLNYLYTDDGEIGVSRVPYSSHPIAMTFVEDVKREPDALSSIKVGGKELKEWLVHRKATGHIHDTKLDAAEAVYFYSYSIGSGAIGVSTFEPVGDELLDILKRFRNVYYLAHQLFTDIVKAENQAREAQVEVALERIRARAMSMRHSDELEEVAELMWEQMGLLGQKELETTAVHLYEGDGDTIDTWFALREGDSGQVISGKAVFHRDGAGLLREMVSGYNSADVEYTLTATGDKMMEFYQVLLNVAPDAVKHIGEDLPEKVFYHITDFSGGSLVTVLLSEPYDELKALQRRLSTVFDLAYTRFKDIKIAEDQAREARIEVALERIRSRSMAMNDSDELAEVAAMLFREMNALSFLPPNTRTYFSLIDEPSMTADVWLTKEDGSVRLGSHRVGFSGSEIVMRVWEAWKKKDPIVVRDLTGDELLSYLRFLSTLPHVKADKGLTNIVENPPKRIVYTDSPFTYGIVGIMSGEPLEEVARETLIRFAGVFDLTYTRFLDLQRLKDEKKRTEDTLDNLKATQEQLVHSEKMASLGELTAGIAHEIQNPLNFVNNFSEVSVDLLREMYEELNDGNPEEVKTIAEDLKQNLEKISYHGHRASTIVKGMLEHSRSGSGHKELTNINELADEYLRLAYHGLKAKDKTFNANFITRLDKKMPKVKVISQDIGRVLLNLINNSFYAVSRRSKSETNGYSPEVIVSTKYTEDQVEIRVTDNGGGIPQEVMDKIFQPFFSTKPSGEGTGLGLSLAFDIINKGHGGSLDVESEVDQGTTFIIKLPVGQ